MGMLCKGSVTPITQHPSDQCRRLFIAFDQSHITKNVRSQILAKDMGGDKQISATPLKNLYRMQRGSVVKPVRFLTRRHLYPSNIEKTGMKTAVQVFSPLVTAALQYMMSEAGHTCDVEFASVGPTLEFMMMMHRWFVMVDVSNTTQHIHKHDTDSQEFRGVDDARLQ
ncbi:hypothetical protein HPB50_008854 [Hyalomma asiaticum]|uniref:Uncharacterized protein n=1 Tax=Hyalomma asiaticum TaxID=266040 RepID=A0ACB7SUF9_HYAAI|nr:hypothetical protein HPB50_008854 [Hyalomma asiaticum]